MPRGVLAVASRALLDACQSLGHDPRRVAALAGVDLAGLADPDARLDPERADALWRAATEVSADPALALHAAAATAFGAFRVLDYLAVSGATVGEGLLRAARYFPLIDPRGRIDVRPGREAVSLVFSSAVRGHLPQPAQEYTLAVFAGRVRAAAAAPLALAGVRFDCPRPGDPRLHERIFGVRPRFDAGEAALVLSREAWAAPTRTRDLALFSLLEDHARRLSEVPREGATLVDEVKAAVAVELNGGVPSLAAIARRLALSSRTLQRRLDAAGTSFERLVDGVRHRRAEELLASSRVAIAEASWLLGFSEQSAFTRAFRRWTGLAPAAWRKRAAAQRPGAQRS